MIYKDLNLKKIREDNNLDFAHYTYQRGMCSCCYGPKDLPKRYWKNNTIPDGDNYTYILFKNADNGCGVAKGTDEIKDYTCIEWRSSMEQLQNICKDLQTQLGDEYVVLKPKNDLRCIVICKSGSIYIENHLKDGYYTAVQND